MSETNGDGIGRVVDASGVSSVVNNCFTMLRCTCVNVIVSYYNIMCLGKAERLF